MERIRIKFEKTGAMRYTSHLDLQKVWIRALLRAKLPLAYTQGFHPTPKVGYAWPLPLGLPRGARWAAVCWPRGSRAGSQSSLPGESWIPRLRAPAC